MEKKRLNGKENRKMIKNRGHIFKEETQREKRYTL